MIRNRRWWLLVAVVPLLPLIYLPLRAQEAPPAEEAPDPAASAPAPASAAEPAPVAEPEEDESSVDPLSADNNLSFPVDI